MAKTIIEWTDFTWNPITGCSVTSPGCKSCYAMRLAGTRLQHHPSRAGLTQPSKAGPVWTGEVRLNEEWLAQPLRWRRPRRIFVCAHGDLFHENVPDEWIDRIFAVMALAPQHTFQVLTKRAARMRTYMDRALGRIADAVQPMRTDNNRVVGPLPHIEPARRWWPLANVWLGVSVEDQQRADERIPELLATPAALRWISAEPLLGAVDLTAIYLGPSEAREREPSGLWSVDTLTGLHEDAEDIVPGVLGSPDPKIDWVIAGGESGPHARPAHPDWFRSLRDQCALAGVPFFFKQWGEWANAEDCVGGDWRVAHWSDGAMSARVGKKAAGRLLDSVEHNGMPEDRP
jgi:protein gp37